MKIQVKHEHFQRGFCGESDSCPVALAFHDVGIKDVSVFDLALIIDGEHYDAPQIVIDFIEKWDDPVKEEPKIDDWSPLMFEPFEFEIQLKPAA